MPLMIKNFKNPLRKVLTNYKYDPMKDGVTQSILSLWMECREKSRLGTLEGLTPTFCSKPLTYGSISHAAIEQYYLGLQNKSINKLDDAYSQIEDWLELGFKAFELENPKANSEAVQIAEESCAVLAEVLPRYFKHWFLKDKAVSWEKVEEKFVVNINAATHITGKYDGVFRKRGGLWLMETKNKGQFSERMIDFLPLDSQLGIYLTALGTKEDPQGVVYNMIRRPQERRKVNESLSIYARRVAENIVSKPDHYFVRYELELTRGEKDEHRRRTVHLVNEFYRWWKDTDHSQRDLGWNSNACDGRFGTCDKLPICAHNDRTFHYVRSQVSPELASTH